MNAIKILASAVVLIWVVGMVVLSAGGPALVGNSDAAAEALVEASGIKEQIAKVDNERCRLAQLNYDKLWDRAVDENKMDRMEESLDRAKASVDAYCAKS